MKATLFALFVALLMVGCGEDVVDGSKLQDRNGVTYLPNEETPFTGRAESFYENGQKKEERNYKDGKWDGFYTVWYRNGQKEEESNWRDGKLMFAFVWKPNGEKCPVTNVKDGNGVLVWYNDDGTERGRHTYKDGE
ncbi:hypothetical protein OAK38_09295 [Verrucomicrobia bacterium]|nr:hypothetical protein [Verrucomicrobiota bacterium]